MPRRFAMFLTWLHTAVDTLHRTLTGGTLPVRYRQDAQLLLCIVGFSCLAFGFELTSPTLGIDDFSHILQPFNWNSFWISRGMWGSLVLQSITPGGWITPFIALFIGIVLQSLTALMLCWLFHLGELGYGRRFLVCALYAVFPYFAAQMAFSYMQIAYPLAAFLCIAALFLARRGALLPGLLGAVLIAAGISLYQGCIGVLVTAAVLALFFDAHHAIKKGDVRNHAREILFRFFRTGCVILAGAAIYYFAHKIILSVTGLDAGEGIYSVQFDIAFWTRWEFMEEEIELLLLGAGGLVPQFAQLLFLLVAVGAVFRVLLNVPIRWWVIALPLLLLVVAVVALAPFVVMFIYEGALSPRSATAVSLLWVAVWAYAFVNYEAASIQRALLVAAFLVLLNFVFQNNRMFYGQHLVEQAEMLTVGRIAERISMLKSQDSDQPIKGILVAGGYSHRAIPAVVRYCKSAPGYSQLEWPTDTPHYSLAALSKVRGIEQYHSYPFSVLGEGVTSAQVVRGRRPWPHSDSVFLHKNYAVVWLGRRRIDCGEGSFESWLRSWVPGS